jgi:hypothetical protein
VCRAKVVPSSDSERGANLLIASASVLMRWFVWLRMSIHATVSRAATF